MGDKAAADNSITGNRGDVVTGDMTSDATGDITSDITWMTYAELGQVRGISTASAKRLAIRRHWRRHRGNDGTARVAVPVTEQSQRATLTSDNTGDGTGDITTAVRAFETALAALQAAKDGHISTLREQLDWADGKIARQEAELTALRAAVQRTEKALDRYYQAEAERKGRGRLARLRAAWWGE
jgi:hypothetical protein